MGERVTFKSSTGPNLAGIIEVPDGAVRGWGVFAHGFTLGKDSPAAARICKQLATDGIGMLRFDNRPAARSGHDRDRVAVPVDGPANEPTRAPD